MEWTNLEIQCLHDMLQQGMGINHIARELGRCRTSVIKASKKIMFQQLLYHDPSEVAANYNMSLYELRDTVVDKKFYITSVSQVKLMYL